MEHLFVVVSPLGEELHTSKLSSVDQLKEEIEVKLSYKTFSQQLSGFRRRRATEVDVTTNISSNEEVMEVLITPTWYPSFFEVGQSLISSLFTLLFYFMFFDKDMKLRDSSILQTTVKILESKAFKRLKNPLVKLMSLVLVLILGVSILAISAQVSITLPISTVPITGQTFAVLLIGSLMGFVMGPLSVLIYLILGAAGIPWFANGNSGLDILFSSSTSGYLVGFFFSSLFSGFCCSKSAADRRVLWNIVLITMVLSNSITFVFGLLWLAYGTAQYGLPKAVKVGLIPYVPGECIKIALVSVCMPLLWKLLYWLRSKVLAGIKMKQQKMESLTVSSALSNDAPIEIVHHEMLSDVSTTDNRCISEVSTNSQL
ncbi:hypothetical protein ABK040_012199 [Willaertia magna]